MANLKRLRVYPNTWEALWGEPVEANVYVLRSIPLTISNLMYGDRVWATDRCNITRLLKAGPYWKSVLRFSRVEEGKQIEAVVGEIQGARLEILAQPTARLMGVAGMAHLQPREAIKKFFNTINPDIVVIPKDVMGEKPVKLEVSPQRYTARADDFHILT